MLMPVLVAVSVLMLAVQQPGVAGSTLGSLPDPQPSPRVQMPPRDRPVLPQRTGTAVIRGRVVDAVTGQPLVHAQVRLSGPIGRPPVITTDATGAFAFGNLPAGRYSLSIQKPGYSYANYPELTRSMRAHNGLTLADGQSLDRLTIPLYRGSAITGHLVDAYGDPVDYTSVQAVRVPGSRPAPPGGSYSGSQTNDAGEFRLGRLAAGTYLVVAMPSGGRGSWDGGENEPTARVPTYYPGVASLDQAQPIVIERGQTIGNIDFQMVEQQVTTVSGMVLDATGQPAKGGNVDAQIRLGTYTTTSAMASIRADGTFDMKLAPGSYRLNANVINPDPAGNDRPAPPPMGRSSFSVISGTGSGNPAGGVRMMQLQQQMANEQQSGSLRLTVSGEPVSNVVINAGKGGSISGRVVFEGDGPPADPSQITITAQSRRAFAPGSQPFAEAPDDCRGFSTSGVNADMTFTLENVRGACSLSIGVRAAGRWRAKSAMYRGADLLDRPVDVSNGQNVRDVQVVVSNRTTELSADVSDDRGATQEYVLIAFSTDKPRWLEQRYVASAAPPPPPPPSSSTSTPTPPQMIMTGRSSAGTITVLPPGDYYVVAIDDAAYEDLHDPAFLEQLIPSATRVTLRESEPQKLQLRRIAAPRPGQ